MAIIVMGNFGGDLDGTIVLVAGFTSASAADYLGPMGGTGSNLSGRAAGTKDQTIGKLGPVTGFWEPAMLGLAMEML